MRSRREALKMKRYTFLGRMRHMRSHPFSIVKAQLSVRGLGMWGATRCPAGDTENGLWRIFIVVKNVI
jgi:hypothetical protein